MPPLLICNPDYIPFATGQPANNPPQAAKTQTMIATAAATFHPLTRPTLNSEGRFTAGPAKSSATAAPSGNPPASRPRESGISRNVGRANGTATVAVTRIAV